jgi:hypothetical protein
MKNKIRFNCLNFHATTPVIPPHCYNCAMRDGYPSNLGGDEQCAKFMISYPIVTSHRLCEKCGKEMRTHGWKVSTNEAICI